MKINIKVKPAAPKSEVIERNGEFTVFTTAHAHGGRANEAVRRLVADYFKVSPGRVRIIQGTTSRRKTLEII